VEGAEEIELKLAVGGPLDLQAVAAAAVRRGARAQPARRQENRFFDAPDGRLRRADLTLRLRAEEGRFQLTAKGPLAPAPDPALHQRAEEEADLGADEARALLSSPAGALDALARALGHASALVARMRRILEGGELVHAGAFENERTVVGPLLAGGAQVFLELDRTLFPGGRVDCEVELELPADAVEDGRALLQDLLRDAGVEGRPAASKAARFFEALERARGERGG
jgi:inorganic triphosphatase YgiF